jgi:hypothetical protein
MPSLWEAERIEGCQSGGRTRPLLVSCVLVGSDDAVLERETMIVKMLGLPEVTDQSLFSEFFGNQLASRFGIDTPAVHLIEVDADVLTANRAFLQQLGVSPRPGVAVGCEQRRGMAPLSSQYPAKGQPEIDDAFRIFAFDLLVQNPDRRVDNHNCANCRGRLVAFDFEMAFSFLYPIIGVVRPWEVSRLPFVRRHVFLDVLSTANRQGRIAWASIRDDLQRLNSAVDDLAACVPENWRHFSRRVAEHVHEVYTHLGDFEQQLQESLL